MLFDVYCGIVVTDYGTCCADYGVAFVFQLQQDVAFVLSVGSDEAVGTAEAEGIAVLVCGIGRDGQGVKIRFAVTIEELHVASRPDVGCVTIGGVVHKQVFLGNVESSLVRLAFQSGVDVLIHLFKMVGMARIPHHGSVKLSLRDMMFLKNFLYVEIAVLLLVVALCFCHSLCHVIVVQNAFHLPLGNDVGWKFHATSGE